MMFECDLYEKIENCLISDNLKENNNELDRCARFRSFPKNTIEMN